MKIVCRTSSRGETLIKEMELGGALTGHRITELRLNKRDVAILVRRLTSGSEIEKERTINWLSHLAIKFPPEDTL